LISQLNGIPPNPDTFTVYEKYEDAGYLVFIANICNFGSVAIGWSNKYFGAGNFDRQKRNLKYLPFSFLEISKLFRECSP
jgi:hypothetical protein